MKLKSLAIIPLVALGACSSSTQSDFTCPAPRGLGCVSMSEADSHVHGNNQVPVKQGLKRSHSDYGVTLNAIIRGEPDENKERARAWTGPSRSLEQVWRIWFPSFVDQTGNYHADSEIYIAIPTDTWIETGVEQ